VIEEYAHHSGQADLPRERIDGRWVSSHSSTQITTFCVALAWQAGGSLQNEYSAGRMWRVLLALLLRSGPASVVLGRRTGLSAESAPGRAGW
jgi:Protein of unknown function (DUF664)